MTVSELHAVATTGYAGISGGIMAASIRIGIDPSYLITACAMSAPAALAVSKILYPETEKTQSDYDTSAKVNPKRYHNVINAIAAGGLSAVPTVVNLLMSFIAALGIMESINAILSWVGGMVGYPSLNFGSISAWFFMPMTYLMGVEWDDCFLAAEMIGVKIVTNTLIGFKNLLVLADNRKLGVGPSLSRRSELITTYAMCGFSNVVSIGTTLGTLSSLAPSRAEELSSIAIRALIAGNAANFMTACIAGILYDDDIDGLMSNFDAMLNATNSSIPTNSSFGDLLSWNTTDAL
ncbi:solute carrier family 28 member 3-like [Ptychodera flava]|uniref:solute carrier family 28 member 3-like n=1 Tax=Ptychodera flava TaxID=63121 RepID=UPI00396A5668